MNSVPTFDSTQLDAELRAAGLSIVGCSSDGRIDWASPPTPTQLTTAQAVLVAHDPASRQATKSAVRFAEQQDAVLLGTGTSEMRLQRLERLAAALYRR